MIVFDLVLVALFACYFLDVLTGMVARRLK